MEIEKDKTKKHKSTKDKLEKDKTKKHKSTKDKLEKNKSKKDKLKKDKSNINDFELLNALEFSVLNNNLSNDFLNMKLKDKNKSSKKHKLKKDKVVIHTNNTTNNNTSNIDNVDNVDNVDNLNIIDNLNMNDNNKSLDNYGNNDNYENYNSDDTDYLEKKLVKNNTILEKKKLILSSIDTKEQEKNAKPINKVSQYKNTVNSLIQNEVIWYSDDLDTDELEKKFKSKYNKLNKVNEVNIQQDIIEDINDNNDNNDDNNNDVNFVDIINYNVDNIYKLVPNKNNKVLEYNLEPYKIYSVPNEVEKYFTSNAQVTAVKKVYRRVLDCKKCILECKKIDFNVFVCDTNCDPNYSSHKLFNNNFVLTHLNNMFFVSDGKKYIPDIVEIYLNENILLKRIYSDITKNINQSNIIEEYNIAYELFHLFTNVKITLKIIDEKQIDNVYFNTCFEKIEECDKNCCLDEKIPIDIIFTTHELLYEGTETDIKISAEYGYYKDIYIICENIIDNIKSISLINTDVILFNSIPIYILEPETNLIKYSLKFGNDIMLGLKIDSNNWINIKLDKINPDKKIKIYGNKLSIFPKQSIFKNN